MLALIKTLSQFRWSCHWAVTLSLWPCLLHPNKSIERGFQESLSCFKSVHVDPLSWSIWLVPSIVWVGEVRSNMDWCGWIVRLYVLTADLTPLFPPQFSPWLQLATRPPLFLSFHPPSMSVSARSQITIITKTKVNSPSKHHTPQRAHDYGLEEFWESHSRPLRAHAFDSSEAKIWQDQQQQRNFIYKTHG